MESKLSQLINLVQRLPEEHQDAAIEFLSGKIEESAENKPNPPCPHCGSGNITRFGQKQGRQRYRCKECRKTYVETTHTVMYQSHYGEAVWKQAIRDTIEGASLDQTAESMGVSHATAFNMRHKILLSLEAEEEREPTTLEGVCELDDTYVLESLKGTKIPGGYWRGARKHGAKAQKRGVSSEYLCICTGVERNGPAVSKTVTRATPDGEDIKAVFSGRIGSDALLLCDGATSYNALSDACECTVRNVCGENNNSKGGKGFFNINTVNNFHSFIKDRYNHYRGVATKYLNRYNILFSKVYKDSGKLVDDIYNILFSNTVDHFHSIEDVKDLNLLNI
jgi:transposase-like protein